MDISDEKSVEPLSGELGRSETREASGPQINSVTIAHVGEFYIGRDMGYSEDERNGSVENWYEPVMCKHYGTPSQQWLLSDHEGK